MKDDYLFPRIIPQEYEDFRILVKSDFPQTYDALSQFVNKRRIEESERGYNFKEVYVNPHEYTRYCEATGQGHNWASLGRFVEEKDSGNSY